MAETIQAMATAVPEVTDSANTATVTTMEINGADGPIKDGIGGDLIPSPEPGPQLQGQGQAQPYAQPQAQPESGAQPQAQAPPQLTTPPLSALAALRARSEPQEEIVYPARSNTVQTDAVQPPAGAATGVELEPQTLLILTGLPGSGKSTFAHALTSLPTGPHPHRKWTRASQDDSVSKRRQEVEATVLAALGRGENVVVDRVNFDAEQRAHFVNLAPAGVRVWALVLAPPENVLRDRLAVRTDHPTLKDPETALAVLGRMRRAFVYPEHWEGFARVLVVRDWAVGDIEAILELVEREGGERGGGGRGRGRGRGRGMGRGRGVPVGGRGMPHPRGMPLGRGRGTDRRPRSSGHGHEWPAYAGPALGHEEPRDAGRGRGGYGHGYGRGGGQSYGGGPAFPGPGYAGAPAAPPGGYHPGHAYGQGQGYGYGPRPGYSAGSGPGGSAGGTVRSGSQWQRPPPPPPPGSLGPQAPAWNGGSR